MGRRKAEESDPKEQLVREICSISSAFASCTHQGRSTRKPVFIDWYLILRIDEDAGIDVVRKRYRQLALQLHPDKNKHPKAEVAFKLVSEAHACLSDEARRRAFNSERWNSVCRECNRKFQSETWEFPNNVVEKKRGDNTSTTQVRSLRIFQALKELRDRLKEEAKVVESCLKAREASRKGFPLFDPSDYLLFPDYPHRGLRVPKDVWYLHTGDVRSYRSRRGSSCESPVYEISSERKTKSQDFR